MLTDIYNISGAHCDQYVAFLTIGEQIILDLIKSREVFTRGSQFQNLFLEIFGGNTDGICLSCRINICQNDMVSQSQSFGKLRKEGFSTGVCMRLEYTP